MAVAVVVSLTPLFLKKEMVNETKGLNISWENCCGGSILLTQLYFSFPSITFTCMLAM